MKKQLQFWPKTQNLRAIPFCWTLHLTTTFMQKNKKGTPNFQKKEELGGIVKTKCTSKGISLIKNHQLHIEWQNIQYIQYWISYQISRSWYHYFRTLNIINFSATLHHTGGCVLFVGTLILLRNILDVSLKARTHLKYTLRGSTLRFLIIILWYKISDSWWEIITVTRLPSYPEMTFDTELGKLLIHSSRTAAQLLFTMTFIYVGNLAASPAQGRS